MSLISCFVLYLLLILSEKIHGVDYDLTVVGQVKFAESLPRLSLGIIDCLKDYLNINFIPTLGDYDLTDVPHKVRNIIENRSRKPGKVALFLDMLWNKYTFPARYIPNSPIKIAYSMLESTAIPREWVIILNSKFDAVVVPDIFYKNIYSRCGVKIPIFVIPCGFYLEEFFEQPLKSTCSMPFVFGMSAAFNNRKNYKLLIIAFALEFGNNPNVILKLHGRAGADYSNILNIINYYKLKNIIVINKSLSRNEYLEFIKSLDCFVLLSKGEGFSLTPREALALGIPCIISNNTAQETICQTDFVYSVPSKILQPAYYACFNQYCGNQFNCSIADARFALKEVYNNYHVYINKACNGRRWVEQYLYKNLKDQYLALIKPKNVILSDENRIEGENLITNSIKLYKKYLSN